MSIFRTAQVILFSDDLPRAGAFYTRLGFTQTFRVPADGEPIHVDLALDRRHPLPPTTISSQVEHRPWHRRTYGSVGC